SSLSTPQPPLSTPFPSTTLFRSGAPTPAGSSDETSRSETKGTTHARHGHHHPPEQGFNCKRLRHGRSAAGASRQARTDGRHPPGDRKSTRLNSSHVKISYAVFCL